MFSSESRRPEKHTGFACARGGRFVEPRRSSLVTWLSTSARLLRPGTTNQVVRELSRQAKIDGRYAMKRSPTRAGLVDAGIVQALNLIAEDLQTAVETVLQRVLGVTDPEYEDVVQNSLER